MLKSNGKKIGILLIILFISVYAIFAIYETTQLSYDTAMEAIYAKEDFYRHLPDEGMEQSITVEHDKQKAIFIKLENGDIGTGLVIEGLFGWRFQSGGIIITKDFESYSESSAIPYSSGNNEIVYGIASEKVHEVTVNDKPVDLYTLKDVQIWVVFREKYEFDSNEHLVISAYDENGNELITLY